MNDIPTTPMPAPEPISALPPPDSMASTRAPMPAPMPPAPMPAPAMGPAPAPMPAPPAPMPAPAMPVNSDKSLPQEQVIITKGGYEQRTFTNSAGIEITTRTPISDTSPKDRKRGGDHHFEILKTALGGSVIESAVSGVRLGDETYTVEVTNREGGPSDKSQYVRIARDSDRIKSVALVNENGMSDKLKEQVRAAIAPKGDGGTSLTYKEAEGILKEMLCPDQTPPVPKDPAPPKEPRR